MVAPSPQTPTSQPPDFFFAFATLEPYGLRHPALMPPARPTLMPAACGDGVSICTGVSTGLAATQRQKAASALNDHTSI